MSSRAVAADATSGYKERSLLSDLNIYFNNYPSEDNFTDFTLLDFLGGGRNGFNDESASINISNSKASNPALTNESLISDYLDDLLNDLDSDLKEGATCRG